jgi:ACS family D-galactonate transporter-like MFS transporter
LTVGIWKRNIPEAYRLHNQTEDGRALAPFGPVLLLLFFAILINYVDRGNLSVAAPLLQREWHISPSTLGILFSAFFWTYTTMLFVSGWLTDRLGAFFVMGIGYVVWSLSTVATGLVSGFAMLVLMRLALGIGESVMFPASSKILAEHVPEEARGFANGVISAGMKAGPAVGTFVGGLLMARYGWRYSFVVLGLASLLWVPAWIGWGPRVPRRIDNAGGHGPSVLDIVRQRSFWGATAGQFFWGFQHYFVVIWLPLYLVNEVHMSMREMARSAGVYFLLEAAAALGTGWVADAYIRRGHTPSSVRKPIMGLSCAIGSVGLVCCAVAGPHGYLWCLPIVALGGGASASGVFAFSQTLAGPLAAGRWVGLQNGLGNFSGVLGPALTGYLIDRTGGFAAPLLITAVLLLIGGFAWVFLTGPLEPVRWLPTAPVAPAMPAVLP